MLSKRGETFFIYTTRMSKEMKTAKQQAIENAYGEYWDKVKDYVNDNGWITELHTSIHYETSEVGIYLNSFIYDINIHFEVIGNRLIPKSLIGIHDNNGWIIIESEDDLPTKAATFRFINKSGDIENVFFTNDRQCLGYYLRLFTHYKPITPELKPLY